MAIPLKILFITAEAEPFAKTGGLADVSGSLPKALHRLGHDVRIAMPAYPSIEAANQTGKWEWAQFPDFYQCRFVAEFYLQEFFAQKFRELQSRFTSLLNTIYSIAQNLWIQ